MKTCLIPLVLFMALIQTPLALAQTNKIINPNPLKAKASLSSYSSAPGGEVDLSLELDLAEKHHAYLNQFKFVIKSPKGFRVDDFDLSPVVQFEDKVSGKTKTGIEGKAQLKAPLLIKASVAPGTYQVEGALTYQACTAKYCLLHKVIPIPFEVVIAGNSSSKTNPAPRDLFDMKFSTDQSLWAILLIVFFAGILTSLTPCIYPMIPITLAIIGTKSRDLSRWRAFTLSLTYVLGIAFTYSLLGVFAATTGALFGSLLGHPVVVGLLALMFISFGLSMYGLFEVKIPDSVANRLGTGKRGSGYFGAFIFGLIAGVIASPCTGPVLGAVLAYIAQSQNVVFGFFLMFTYAMGFGLLLLLLGTFSQLSNKIPRSGPWMELVKFVVGTLMIGLAFFYLQPILPLRVFDILAGLSVVAIASFFGAFLPNKDLHPIQRLQKGLMILVLILGVLLVVRGGFPQLFDGGLSTSTSQPHSKVPWKTYSPGEIELAKAQGKAVILDFYADWCAACKELDEYTFSEDSVRERTKDFVWLQYDATQGSPEFDRLKEQFQILGLPHVVFIDTKGEWREDLTLTGFEKTEKFLERIKDL